MDRVSAVLIIGIIGFMMISGMIVYDTWIADDDRAYEVLIFNDDTSITNNSDSRLWIRARVAEWDVAEEESQHLINDGFWIDGSDGWYYYVQHIDFAQATEPFVAPEVYATVYPDEDTGNTFSLDVEAVDQAWLIETPSSCKDAFKMIKRSERENGPIYL